MRVGTKIQLSLLVVLIFGCVPGKNRLGALLERLRDDVLLPNSHIFATTLTKDNNAAAAAVMKLAAAPVTASDPSHGGASDGGCGAWVDASLDGGVRLRRLRLGDGGGCATTGCLLKARSTWHILPEVQKGPSYRVPLASIRCRRVSLAYLRLR